jgi:hypothetical protein
MNTDGNLAALRRYERDMDRLMEAEVRLEELERQIWEEDSLLLKAVRAAPDNAKICDAVASYSLRMFKEESSK